MTLFFPCQTSKTAINWLSGQLSGSNLESLPLCFWPFLIAGTAFFVILTKFPPNLGMDKDNQNLLPYKPAVLRDRKGDLTKEWYVEFYAMDDRKGELVRKRIVISMHFRDKRSRTAEGNRIVALANDLLKKGYHFTSKKTELTPDALQMNQDLIKSLQFVLDTTKGTIADKTIVTYQSAINKFEEYAPKHGFDIRDFSTKEATLFRDHLLNVKNNSPRTANNTLQHLTAIFSKLQERTGIEKNPFKIKSLREPATLKNIAFTDEDRAKVEEYLIKHEPGVYLFTRLMYFAFIRPGEILKLQFGHIHMREAYITVHGLISKNGKTETAQIIPALAHELQTRLVFQKPDHYLFSTGIMPGKYPLSKQVPFRRHEKALEQLGLLEKGYTLYSWKHTGAVNAYRAGVGIKELQSMLRHSSIQITDIYLKSLGLRTDPNLKNYSW
jgi:integrase